MLIITRYIHEEFSIGDDIRVKVLGINGTNVRIGIEAPKDIAIERDNIKTRRKKDE